MVSLAFFLFFSSAGTGLTQTMQSTTDPGPILRITGPSRVLEDEVVQLKCSGDNVYNTSWYHWDHPVSGGYSVTLTFKASVNKTGKYKCCMRMSLQTQVCSDTVDLVIVEKLSPLRVVTIPSHSIIVEGDTLTLHCDASTVPSAVNWSWHRWTDHAGSELVGSSRDLTLTKAEESAQYSCRALSDIQGIKQDEQSPNHTVYIISLPTTVVGKLGLTAFILSFLAWIIILSILLWLCYQRANDRAAPHVTSALAKGIDGPAVTAVAPKGDVPHSGDEGGVYMNYRPTSTNQRFSDLDTTYMTGDDYQILS